jgi:hypothetical protein
MQAQWPLAEHPGALSKRFEKPFQLADRIKSLGCYGMDMGVDPMNDFWQSSLVIANNLDGQLSHGSHGMIAPVSSCYVLQDKAQQSCIVIIVKSVRLVGEELVSGDPLLEMTYFHCTRDNPRMMEFASELQRLMVKAEADGKPGVQQIKATVEEQQIWLTALSRNTLALDSKYLKACKKNAPTAFYQFSFLQPAAPVEPAAEVRPNRQCGNCPALGEQFKLCGRCHAMAYCSIDCQKAHWKTHKKVCAVPVAELPAQAGSVVIPLESPEENAPFLTAISFKTGKASNKPHLSRSTEGKSFKFYNPYVFFPSFFCSVQPLLFELIHLTTMI